MINGVSNRRRVLESDAAHHFPPVFLQQCRYEHIICGTNQNHSILHCPLRDQYVYISRALKSLLKIELQFNLSYSPGRRNSLYIHGISTWSTMWKRFVYRIVFFASKSYSLFHNKFFSIQIVCSTGCPHCSEPGFGTRNGKFRNETKLIAVSFWNFFSVTQTYRNKENMTIFNLRYHFLVK
jgi:hypothetical protein